MHINNGNVTHLFVQLVIFPKVIDFRVGTESNFSLMDIFASDSPRAPLTAPVPSVATYFSIIS